MVWLIAGLALFLGAHSVQIVAGGWRAGVIRRLGEGAWKGVYALIALVGLALVVHGYGQSRDAVPLYTVPHGIAHLTLLLVWAGFIGVVAAYWPANHIKRALRDPMVVGVGLWALGHLLAKATPAALILFGSFLVWAVADFLSLRWRGQTAPAAGAAPRALNTVLVVITGTILAAVFAHVLHVWLIGVAPFGQGE